MTTLTLETDASLLGQYARTRSQEAFAELTSRHADWIYSAALRMVRDPHQAQDIAQAVFVILASKASSLDGRPLHAWLFKVTRYAAANAMRTRARREKYEREGAMLNGQSRQKNPDPIWDDIAPMLDEFLDRLRSRDRDAILLRFYQGKSLADVGAALGVSEDAARQRIGRAVEKLRGLFRRQGVVVPSLAFAAALSAHTTHAAPATLTAGFSLASASASVATATLTKGTTSMLMAAKLKLAAVIAAIVLVPAGVGTILMVATVKSAPTQPAVAAAIAAPATVPVDLPPAEVSSDAGLIPFLNSNVGLIAVFDVSEIDPAAVQAKIAGMSFSNPSALQRAREQSKKFTQLIPQFRQAGGKQLYMLLPFQGNASKNGVTIVPFAKGADAATLQGMIGQGPDRDAIFNNAAVESSDINQIKNAAPEPRPDLTEALAASDSALRCIYVPSILRNQKAFADHKDVEIVGADPTLYPEPQWDNVKWFLLEIVQIPDQPSQATYQCKDHDSAVALTRLLTQKVNASKPGAKLGEWPYFFELFRGAQIQANGDRVEITLDSHAVDAVCVGPALVGPNP